MTVPSESRRGFPREEYEIRVAGAQALMADDDVDAMLLTTEPDFRYFTGFLTPFWLSPTRPWFLVVPAAGNPVAVIPEIGRPLLSTSWIDDLRTWPAPRPVDDGVTLLGEVLREVADRRGAIGVPMGHGTQLRMPLADFDRLRMAHGELQFVDATSIVRSLRMVKSGREVAKIAQICSIVSNAFDAVPGMLGVGMTERDAFRRFRMALLAAGADEVPYLVGASGPGFANIIGPPGDRVMVPGDLLMFDTGAVWDGYYSDFDRYFVFGAPDDRAAAAYRTVWAATEAGLDMLRPGATARDVWHAMAVVLERDRGRVGEVGRMGHGLGSQLTEWPSISPGDDTVITEGMVLTLEPGMEWAPGKLMVHEENVVIRGDGPQLLSRRAAPELPSIAGGSIG